MPVYADWNADVARSIVEAQKTLPGAMLPILHALQEEFGYVDKTAIPVIAEALNVSRAEVYGVVTFYHDFRQKKAGRRVLKLCRAEACQSMGCESLVSHLSSEHGVALDSTTDDGRLTVETVYCLGNCALSPAALLDGELIGRVDKSFLDDLCNDREPGRP